MILKSHQLFSPADVWFWFFFLIDVVHEQHIQGYAVSGRDHPHPHPNHSPEANPDLLTHNSSRKMFCSYSSAYVFTLFLCTLKGSSLQPVLCFPFLNLGAELGLFSLLILDPGWCLGVAWWGMMPNHLLPALISSLGSRPTHSVVWLASPLGRHLTLFVCLASSCPLPAPSPHHSPKSAT